MVTTGYSLVTPIAADRKAAQFAQMIIASSDSDNVDCKNEGLEEETLVTSSNPFSQVLW